jgi:urocanate reductase
VNRKIFRAVTTLLVAASMLFMVAGCGGSNSFTPGTYSASAEAMHGDVTVTITVSNKEITAISIADEEEGEGFTADAYATLSAQILKAQSADVDGVSGATITTNAVKEAAVAAIVQAEGGSVEIGEIAFNPGTYTGTGGGFYGPVELAVTFSDIAITGMEVASSSETEHVGTSAYGVLFQDIMDCTSTGVDALSGATYTSNAVFMAVEDAAKQAGCDIPALRVGAKPYTLTAGEKISGTYDVVIIGAGGAGVMAGAQAAQNGATVCIIEKEADAGGNTLVSGCSFQNVMECMVWDPANPDATTGYYEPTGETLQKSKSELGRIDTLRMISDWSERPFNEAVSADVENVEDYDLPRRGVHTEFLPTLKTLKSQIRAYLTWAEPQLAAGAEETDITLFSTVELYIFQTYYGGVRLNLEKTEWIYSDYELVEQVCTGIQDTKAWLIEQGSKFNNEQATRTLIGCLWQRINPFDGGVVNGETVEGKWGTYFAVPLNTMLSADDHNTVLYRTTAKELVTDAQGCVTGVKAVQYDGTEVEVIATEGVIIATGGFGYNPEMVVATNDYWNKDNLTVDIKTTNRSLAMGEGITMATAVGAATEGMGFTQLMPISWQNTGFLAYGKGENVIFVSPAGTPNAGKRYVDESAERDVLAQGAYDFGGPSGFFIQIANGGSNTSANDRPNQEYFVTLADASEMLGIDFDILKSTIVEYDDAYNKGTLTSLEVPKRAADALIGNYKADGSFDEDGILSIRYLAPSTHHTMGGLAIDAERHVLDEDGDIIPGLWAAGEVTGGIFAGNRLGGNAVSEVIVSGRIAANSVTGK